MLINVKMVSLRHLYNDHGVATVLAWRCIVFLRSPCWRFSALSRRFHGAHNVCTAHSQRFHCTDSLLKTQCHLKERRTISMQMPQMTTAFARPLYALAKLLLHCRRPYCRGIATSAFCIFLGRRGIAMRLLL